ncbi:hypothetical protein B0A48_03218 [Cryoendolithus antarcticus]|uniref:Mtf2-like C-terminal domain-containing protein n=1 Tax=Cryoendolithus antarcticus TaxID=1507870 RepID=A0A1V8TJS3_9PEZI|nr:hypothetical protein B0A48_03218 [Cryoendolithus antarcticus]
MLQDHNWGFRIYRTTFAPGSDERFATALAVLDANLRVACFREQGPNGDRREKSGPSERLWQRLKSEVIEDRALDGAPPVAVMEHFRAWIKEQGFHLPGAIAPDPALEMASSSTHRFCLLIDEEVLDNLLRFPLPTPFFPTDHKDHIDVKVVDVEIDAKDYNPPYAEGWLWAAPWELLQHADLRQAISDYGDTDAGKWCDEVLLYGTGEQLNWGFRVYRTVYTPDFDDEFPSGLRVLEAYLRDACVDECGRHGPLPDGPANEQLLKRLKLDVIEARELDNASPAVVQQHFQAYVESQGLHLATATSPDPSHKMAGSSSHRFCIIIDFEALSNLLRFPVPVPRLSVDRDDHIGVKVLDVECNEDSVEYEPPYDEGWLWTAPWELAEVWFDCRYRAPSQMRKTNGAGRLVMRLGAAAKTAVVDSALSDGSTVTPSERRAFESLLAMRRVGSARADLDDSEPAGIRGKQNSGAPGHETNNAQKYEAQGSDLEASRAAGPSLDARSAAEIKTVNSLMADAQTDADLWRILQEQVTSRVLALQLDTPQKSAEDLEKARTPPKKAKGKKSKILPVPAVATPVEPATAPTKDTSAPSAQDSHLLTQTFPIHLLNFTKHCASSFPGSSLPSSLLPYIKSLGPTTFAMAATTSLYNHHMSQLYYQYLDVPSIVATIEEMDQQVYEFDTATYNLLGKILHRASEARLGHLGPGTQALWDSERMRSALRGIAEWKTKVLAQMETRALQDVRSRAEWGGWFEVANPNNTTPPPSPGKHRGGRAQRQAAHYITEECERLFCGTLEAVFLVEKGTGLSGPLVMDAHNEEQRSRKTGSRHDYAVRPAAATGSVTDWLEVYDYHGDGVRFRGFVAESPKQRAMFVFFDKDVVAGQDLKPGLTALLELANSDGVDCDQLILGVDRTADEIAAKDLTKDLGWVGFELTMLDDWSGQKCTLSDRWLFLGMDV